jgi:NAD+ diphosphatase
MSPPFDLGPRPHLGYTLSKIDRVAERRLDKDWLAALLTEASTRAVVIGGELIVLKAGDGVNDPRERTVVAREVRDVLKGK